MKDIQYNKIYLLDYKNKGEYDYQAVYLGDKLTKRYPINKHFFMIWDNKMQLGDRPNIVACKYFEIKGNKLELSTSKRNYKTLSELEEEYLKDLAKKYWGQDL